MSQDYRNIYLAIMAIEGGAEKMHLSGRDMYLRLKKQGLVHNYLLKCYDELHTQSKEWLADTTVEALKNWESAVFGQGFYVTKLQEQADKWAKTIAIRKGPKFGPVVSEFVLDYDAVIAAGFNVKIFTEYNIEWLEYVVDCRAGGMLQKQYDVIEGGVANDNVIDTVEDFENGRITVEQALGQLMYKSVNHQLCIRNQGVIDGYLKFVKSYNPSTVK